MENKCKYCLTFYGKPLLELDSISIKTNNRNIVDCKYMYQNAKQVFIKNESSGTFRKNIIMSKMCVKRAI